MYSAASSSDTMFLGEMETNYCTRQLHFCVANTVSSPDFIASSITCAILKVIHAGVGFGSGSETIANTNTAKTILVKVVSQSGYCSFRVQ